MIVVIRIVGVLSVCEYLGRLSASGGAGAFCVSNTKGEGEIGFWGLVYIVSVELVVVVVL